MMRMNPGLIFRVCSAAVLATALHAASVLPDGPGKQLTVTICGKCHSPDRSAALHQSRRAWDMTVAKMVGMGATGTDDQLNEVVNYLAKSFPAPPPRPIDINTATPVDLESSLLLLKSEAKAIVKYRTENGNFKSLDDLRKVPGLDFKKIEEKKDRIAF